MEGQTSAEEATQNLAPKERELEVCRKRRDEAAQNLASKECKLEECRKRRDEAFKNYSQAKDQQDDDIIQYCKTVYQEEQRDVSRRRASFTGRRAVFSF